MGPGGGGGGSDCRHPRGTGAHLSGVTAADLLRFKTAGIDCEPPCAQSWAGRRDHLPGILMSVLRDTTHEYNGG